MFKGYSKRFKNFIAIPKKLIDSKILKFLVKEGWCFKMSNQKNLTVHSPNIELSVELERIDYDIASFVLSINGQFISIILKEILDSNLCKIAIKSNISSLENIPEKFITLDIAYEIVKIECRLINKLPLKFHNEEFYCNAVIKNPLVIRYIPEDMITDRVACECVKQDGRLLKYIPNSYIKYQSYSS